MSGPLTLSFKQFHLKTGGGEQAYTKYLSYVANRRGQLLGGSGGAYDRSLAPTPYGALLGQATHAIQDQMNPYFQQIRDTYGRQLAQGTAAIKGYTDTY